MIRINLLGDDTVIDTSGRKFIAGAIASLVVVLVVCYLVRSSMTAEIDRLTMAIEEQEQKLKELEKVTTEVRDLEKKEAEFNNKILVIAGLKKSKIGPVRVLDDLNLAVPERSWITEIKEEAGVMRVDGRAVDNQTIAAFMKKLEESNYFHSVQLGETRQVDDRGVKIKAFTLGAQVKYAGEGVKLPETEDKKS